MFNLRFVSTVVAGTVLQLASFDGAGLAADLASLKDTAPMDAVVPNWGGLYFGGHAGGMWSPPKVTDTFTYIWRPHDQ